jgi:long-subunit acyl-CoA synthetase (AMP-forming)
MPGIELRLAEDGELLLLRGPNLMLGYRNDPATLSIACGWV